MNIASGQHLGLLMDLDRIAARAKEVLDAESCGIFLVSPTSSDEIQLQAASPERANSDPPIGIRIESVPRHGLTGHIARRLREKEPSNVVRMDAQEIRDSPYVARPYALHLESHRCSSIMVVGLWDRKDRFIGIVKVENKQSPLGPAPFTATDARAALLLSQRVVDAIENVRFFEELKSLMHALQGARNISKTANSILDSALRLVRADRGDFAVWDEAEMELRIVSVSGSTSSTMVYPGFALPRKSFIRHLWDTRPSDHLLSNQVADEQQYHTAHPQTKRELAVAVKRSDGSWIGVLNVESFSTVFDSDDTESLRLLAEFAGLTVVLAEEETEYWRTLGEMLSSGSDERPILDGILRSICRLYKFNAGIIYVADPVSKTLKAKAHMGCDHLALLMSAWSYNFDEHSFASYIFKRKYGEVVSPTSNTVNQEARRKFDIRSPLLGIPLSVNEDAVGAMILWSRAGKEPESRHIALLDPFARLAALKVAHAHKDVALRQSEAIYRSLVDHLSEYIIVKDENFKITFANPRFCEYNGASLGELLGKTDFDLYEEQLAKKYRAGDIEVMETGLPKVWDEPHRSLDGQMRYVHVIKVPIIGPEQQRLGIQVAFTDITEEHLKHQAAIRHQQMLEIEGQINKCQSLEELYDFCVFVLPHSAPFNARYASIFTFSITRGNPSKRQFLVLRRSSYPSLKDSINRDVYDFDPDSSTLSLTEWVATVNRPLRLENLSDHTKLEAELAAYDARIKHKGRIRDSDKYETFLAVPLSQRDAQGARVLGVLRLTQNDSGGGFSAEDEHLLQILATRVIAPKLHELSYRQFTDKLVEHTEVVKQIILEGDTTGSNLHETIESTLSQLFLSDLITSGKTFWVSRLTAGGERFQHVFRRELGHRLYAGFDEGEAPLAGTITGYAIASPTIGYVCVTDFTGSGITTILRAHSPLKCAIACRIRVNHQDIGVVGVGSDLYDIDQVHHGKLLEMVSAEIGQALAQKISRPMFTQAAFRHDTLLPLDIAANTLCSSDEVLTGDMLHRARSAVVFCLYLAQAYCSTYPSVFSTFEPDTRIECNFFSDVMLAKEWAEACKPAGDPIEVHVPEGLSFYADPSIIMAIVFNLLINARQHGRSNRSEGKIRIAAAVNGYFFELSVSDEGPGMVDMRINEQIEYDVVKALLEQKDSFRELRRGLGLRSVAFFTQSWKLNGVTGSVKVKFTHEAERRGATFIVRLPICPKS